MWALSRYLGWLLPSPSIDKGACIGRILEDCRHSRYRRRLPAQIAIAITARQCQAAGNEDPHRLRSCSYFQESLEEQQQAFLHLNIGVLGNHARRVAHKTRWQLQGQLTAFGFRQKPGRHSAPNGVQFQLRDRPLQAEQQAAIGCSGDRRCRHGQRSNNDGARRRQVAGTNPNNCEPGASRPSTEQDRFHQE